MVLHAHVYICMVQHQTEGEPRATLHADMCVKQGSYESVDVASLVVTASCAWLPRDDSNLQDYTLLLLLFSASASIIKVVN